MSGGRVELGLGAGWFDGEHAAYGIPFPGVAERFDRLTEQLEIVTGLWRTPPGERFGFAGAHYTLADSPALPKPVQQPAPPVIVGGAGKRRTPQLAARFAAEYNVAFTSIEAATAAFGRAAAACREIGRDPVDLVRSTAHPIAVGRDEEELARRASIIGREVADLRATAFAGTPAEVVDRLGQWRERAGVTRFYLQLLDLADLDQIELIASEVAPQLAPG
jgi:alkanesulfonate monooxygenase